jgi:hypothetical protein
VRFDCFSHTRRWPKKGKEVLRIVDEAMRIGVRMTRETVVVGWRRVVEAGWVASSFVFVSGSGFRFRNSKETRLEMAGMGLRGGRWASAQQLTLV